MLIVDAIRQCDKCFIPPVRPRLVPTDQQDSDAQRVECIKRSQGTPGTLGSQLAHSRMARSYDLRTVRKPEGRTEFGEKTNRVGNVVLLILRQGIPPLAELVGELYFPCHLTQVCAPENNSVNGIITLGRIFVVQGEPVFIPGIYSIQDGSCVRNRGLHAAAYGN